MINHVSIGVKDLDGAADFYDVVIQSLVAKLYLKRIGQECMVRRERAPN